MPLTVSFKTVGRVGDSDVVEYELRSDNTRVRCINYGATILSIKTLRGTDSWEEMTLSYRSFDELYARRASVPYYGCIVGRVANRICRGKFTLNGTEHTLAVNNGENHLHGGIEGFDKKVWRSESVERSTDTGEAVGVQFYLRSADGEEGYPGSVEATVRYVLTADRLTVEYAATADKTTPINLTNHAYFNISGDFQQSAGAHRLQLSCPLYLPVDGTQIPTGVQAAVAGTDFDFLGGGRLLGEAIQRVDGGGRPGLDHCFVVDDAGQAALLGQRTIPASAHSGVPPSKPVALRHVATLSCDARSLTVFSTQPAVQVYTANWLPVQGAEEAAGAEGEEAHRQHNAVCLETQHFPDSVNYRGIDGSVAPAGYILLPGEEYYHQTALVFR